MISFELFRRELIPWKVMSEVCLEGEELMGEMRGEEVLESVFEVGEKASPSNTL